MNTLANLHSFAIRSPIGRSIRCAAMLAAVAACSPASAATYTWDNGVGTADYIGTGQWTNNTNWDPTSPSGGPVAGDDLTFNLYLDNPNVPRTSGTVSGTATDVAWLKSTAGSGTFSINTMTFTGSSAKYIWATTPKTTGTYSTAQFIQPTNGITVAADSGPVFLGNVNNNARAPITFRLQTDQSFVNNSASNLTLGTQYNTPFDGTTLVGGNLTNVNGININGWTASTGTATVVTMSANGTGDIIMNGNFSNGTGGLQLVVNNAGSGRVVSNGNLVFTGATLAGLANPSGLRVLGGTLVVGGSYNGSTTLTVNNGIEIASGAAIEITRTQAMPLFANTYGAGALRYAGGSVLQVSGSLGHTGLTTVSAGTLQLAAGASLGTGNIAVASGATLDVNQPTNLTYSSTITGGGSLTKAGAGVLTLAGNNSFTGGITIASVSGSGGLAMQQLNVSQLITGTGLGTLAISSAADGTLDVSRAVTSGLAFRLGTPGTSDLVTMPGFLNIGSGSLGFTNFAFTRLDGFDSGTYTLFSANTLLGMLGSSTTGPIGSNYTGLLQTAGNTLQLVVTAVPEPSTTAALIAGVAMGGIVLRRRRE